MSLLVFHCKTCGIGYYHDIYINIKNLLNAYNTLHVGHEMGIKYLEDYEVPKSFITRPFVMRIKNATGNKYPLIGVEIGVKYADNAVNMLNNLNIDKLYLVDPYKYYDEYDSDYKQDYVDKSLDDSYKIAKKNLLPYRNKVKIIKNYSSKAIDKIPDNLDFVYIDGNHEYDYVKEDLELYYKKLKIGGYIGGHDFGTHRLGVMKAVIDFIQENNLKSYGNREIDFWIIKEKEI